MQYAQVFFAILAAFIFSATPSFATDCVLDHKTRGQSQVTYQNRGEFCEGLYVQNYSNFEKTEIIGFQVVPILFPIASEDKVSVKLLNKIQQQAQLIVHDVVPLKFYQMDKLFDENEDSFEWDLGIISDTRVNLDAKDIAALACVPDCASKNAELLPVLISAEPPSDSKSIASLIFKLPLDTARVKIRLSDPSTKLTIRDVVVDSNDLNASSLQYMKVSEFSEYPKIKVEITAFLDDGTPSYTSANLLGPN